MLASAQVHPVKYKHRNLKKKKKPTQITRVNLHVLTKSFYKSIIKNINDVLCQYSNSIPEFPRALTYR